MLKVIRAFGSLFDVFFGINSFNEDEWCRISVKGETISHVKGKEIDLKLHGPQLLKAVAEARGRYFSREKNAYTNHV